MDRVLLDCDGVLSNFVGAALPIISRLTGKSYTHEDVTDWAIESLVPIELQPEFWSAVCAPGFVIGMEPYPGAVGAVSVLREHYEVHVVTARMRQSLTWVDEREAWLERHFGLSYKHVTSTHGKHVCSGIALVDDKPSHVREWAAANPGGVGLLWSQPYNANATEGVRVCGWGDVLDELARVSRREPR